VICTNSFQAATRNTSTAGIDAFLSRALGRKHKPWARRITQIMIGFLVLGLLGILGHENMQINTETRCWLA